MTSLHCTAATAAAAAAAARDQHHQKQHGTYQYFCVDPSAQSAISINAPIPNHRLCILGLSGAQYKCCSSSAVIRRPAADFPMNAKRARSQGFIGRGPPRTWNSLSSDIRSCRTVDTFKRHLKTHLFRHS